MQWLNTIVDEAIRRHPDGEILVSSGVSPSGTYHLGTLREVLTAEAIMRELRRRGRLSKHIHVVDDLDIFRKIPVNVDSSFEQYLGKPLCYVPAPSGNGSYADYFLNDLLLAASDLQLDMEIMRAHEKYRSGFFVPAIEKTLANLDTTKFLLENISGRKLESSWTPVQVQEDGYLKNRQFVDINTEQKTLQYLDKDEKTQEINYNSGMVKLSWRVDWPARWWLLGVHVEPFGRDHATKGGSYDTGAAIAEKVFGVEAPLPVPYNFINRTGDTKKMSKSAGDTITAADLLKILPAEVVWYFMLRYSPDKLLFFDQGETLIRLVDEFSELVGLQNKSDQEQQLLDLCMQGINRQTISSIPFSHLVSSYQAALKDPAKTLEIIGRTEHKQTVEQQKQIIEAELVYIDQWLERWAPEEVKFSLRDSCIPDEFSEKEKAFFAGLAEKLTIAPESADGEWFHKAIYEFKEAQGAQPQVLFGSLYRLLIGKNSWTTGWLVSFYSASKVAITAAASRRIIK